MSGRRPKPEPDTCDRAIALLARREHSAHELRRKLAARGQDADDIERALQKLAERGYQDEGRFAEMLVRTRIGAGQGPQRIRAELETHHIADALIEHAFAENHVDWAAEALRVVQRRFRPDEFADPARRRKAIEFLLRRGFDLDMARAAAAPPDPADSTNPM